MRGVYESCHIWMRHVSCDPFRLSLRLVCNECHMSHMNEASYTCINYVTHMNEPCHTCAWVMSHTHEWQAIVHIIKCEINESCHTRQGVMSHIWMRHITHIWMTGHSPPHEAPERVADQVNKFVENVAAVHWVMSLVGKWVVSHTWLSHVAANQVNTLMNGVVAVQ